MQGGTSFSFQSLFTLLKSRLLEWSAGAIAEGCTSLCQTVFEKEFNNLAGGAARSCLVHCKIHSGCLNIKRLLELGASAASWLTKMHETPSQRVSTDTGLAGVPLHFGSE